MAQQTLDTTGNEAWSSVFGKMNANFTDLYGTVSAGAAGNFTTATSTGLATLNSLKLDTGTKTATATAGAATLAKSSGKITSEALTTAGLASYTLTLTNSLVAATDQLFVSVANGTNTQGTLGVGPVVCGSGSATIIIHNLHATEALNGTIVISFMDVKA